MEYIDSNWNILYFTALFKGLALVCIFLRVYSWQRCESETLSHPCQRRQMQQFFVLGVHFLMIAALLLFLCPLGDMRLPLP